MTDLLGPAATSHGRVSHIHQDDEDRLRISVAYSKPEEAYTSMLRADQFEVVQGDAEDAASLGKAFSI